MTGASDVQRVTKQLAHRFINHSMPYSQPGKNYFLMSHKQGELDHIIGQAALLLPQK
jgi:hypothetical protein